MKELLNSYQVGVNLDFLRQYCISNGKMQILRRGDIFQQISNPSHNIGYIEKGFFKYIVHNYAEKKDYITGFAFENEFVADYPNCLYGNTSKVQIETNEESIVHVVEGATVLGLFTENADYRSLCQPFFNPATTTFCDTTSITANTISNAPKAMRTVKLSPNTNTPIIKAVTGSNAPIIAAYVEPMALIDMFINSTEITVGTMASPHTFTHPDSVGGTGCSCVRNRVLTTNTVMPNTITQNDILPTGSFSDAMHPTIIMYIA